MRSWREMRCNDSEPIRDNRDVGMKISEQRLLYREMCGGKWNKRERWVWTRRETRERWEKLNKRERWDRWERLMDGGIYREPEQRTVVT